MANKPVAIFPGVQKDCEKILKSIGPIGVVARACLAAAMTGKTDVMRTSIKKLHLLTEALSERCSMLEETTDHLNDEDGAAPL